MKTYINLFGLVCFGVAIIFLSGMGAATKRQRQNRLPSPKQSPQPVAPSSRMRPLSLPLTARRQT